MQKPDEAPVWNTIDDLPNDWETLSSSSLARLADIWKEQQEHLRKSEAVAKFNTALRRSWAIETGILEGLYTLDRGITALLIERGIEAALIPRDASNRAPTELAAILQDQEKALEWVFDFVGHGRPLSTSWIKELHALLTRHQTHVEGIDQFNRVQEVELVKGDYKMLPNNPRRPDETVHYYCPPEQTASEMDRLIEIHLKHIQNGIPPEVESAWLHHRFTQIHPFQDGNGRVARAISSLVLLRAGWFPLVIDRNERADYIDALERADEGDLKSLVDLFASIQKKAFLKALSISDTIQRERESVQNVVGAALDRLRSRRDAAEAEKIKIFDIAEHLEKLAVHELTSLASELGDQLKTIDRTYRVFVNRAEKGRNDLIVWSPTVTLAPTLGYFADVRTYLSWVELRIKGSRYTDILFSFHSVGRNFSGLLGVICYIEFKDVPAKKDQKDEPIRVDGPHLVSEEVFQFAYTEAPNAIEDRFRKWFNRSLVVALDHWRKQL